MRMLTGIVSVLGLAVFGCGNAPSEADVEEAKALVTKFAAGAEQARYAADLLGLIPEYDCDEPRASFVKDAIKDLKAEFACATVTTETPDDAEIAVVTFPAAGCAVKGHTVSGIARFRYSGGEERMEVELDLREAVVDGTAVKALAGYGTCSDEKRYWIKAEGPLPKAPETTLVLDATIAAQAGLPIIGGTTLVIDGTGQVKTGEAANNFTFTKLVYEVGEYLPKEGTLEITTASGKHIKAVFQPVLWRVGKVEITIDESDPVTVPIVH